MQFNISVADISFTIKCNEDIKKYFKEFETINAGKYLFNIIFVEKKNDKNFLNKEIENVIEYFSSLLYREPALPINENEIITAFEFQLNSFTGNKKFNQFLYEVPKKKNILPNLSGILFYDNNNGYFFCDKNNEVNLPYAFLCYLSQVILLENGILLHSSCLVFNDTAYLFLGKRKAGKSTIVNIHKWNECISEDMVIVRKISDNFIAFPTPYLSSNRLVHSNKKIKYIFLIKDWGKLKIKKINKFEAINEIFHTHIPWIRYATKEARKEAFITLCELVNNAQTFNLTFNISDAPFLHKIDEYISTN